MKRPDIHPDDAAQITKLRVACIGWRYVLNMNQRAITRSSGIGDVSSLEMGKTMPKLSWLQRWAAALHLRLQLSVQIDDEALREAVAADPTVVFLTHMANKQFNTRASQEYQRQSLVAALSALRKEAGVSTDVLGKRLGITAGAVSERENTVRNDTFAATFFQWARALGAQVTFTLLDEDEWGDWKNELA